MKRIVLFNRSIIFNMGIGVFLLALLLLSGKMLIRSDNNVTSTDGHWQIIELSSSEYPYYTYTLTDDEIKELSQKISYKPHSDQRVQRTLPDGNYKFSFEHENGNKSIIQYNYLLGEYYDGELRKIIPSEDCKRQLNDLIHILNKNAHYTYGVPIPWEEVKDIFPLFSYAKVIDIYTGASFMVQRRAGSNHADTQPLTAEDTATMKKIFHGAWSWNRSGIVLEIGNYRIAGSMNGKPHGAGKIQGNNFPGHFCIHFLTSSTHSGSIDLRHHREILKAAGKLPLKDDGSSLSNELKAPSP